MNEAQLVTARALRAHGNSYRWIGEYLGVNESTVRRALKKPAPAPKKRRVTVIIIEEDV